MADCFGHPNNIIWNGLVPPSYLLQQQQQQQQQSHQQQQYNGGDTIQNGMMIPYSQQQQQQQIPANTIVSFNQNNPQRNAALASPVQHSKELLEMLSKI